MQQFLSHLTERGYEVEERAETVWIASHDDLPAMFIVEGVGGFLLRAYFGGLQRTPRESPLQQANRLNRSAVASRFFYDDDDDLVVEAWHPLTYDAEGFNAFLDAWMRDLTSLITAHHTAQRRFDA
jgi:hypothetical protein